ncbi:Microcystin-dependent protein [Paenibacillus sp. 1_12]|uniref:phage tail protein n=1 Tax=Paenibacillus sp. 1_12 TaxID=1566278 RepID=UPI0008EF6C1E|nr:tail fiber protein [Paenibacillus sp. 1_12]SFL21219.1 Microcystin-dependent protein [Paenibacillus sp. 1_12]
MADPYVGEIRMFAGNFAPVGWALCDGQMMSISQNEALYTLIGTTFGGDGQTTFALPDMRGRIPIHRTEAYPLGAKGGAETISLITNELPLHTHVPHASTQTGTQPSPNNAIWATNVASTYTEGNGSPVTMNQQTISLEGGNQQHTNMMPSLTISFIIALEGIFPSLA